MRVKVSLICILYFFQVGYCNQGMVDSIKRSISDVEMVDSVIVYSYLDISYYSSLPNEKEKYAKLALDIAIKNNNTKWKAESKNLEAHAYRLRGQLDKALEALLISRKYYEEIFDLAGIALCYNDIGVIRQSNKEYAKSKIAYLKSINYYLDLSDEYSLSGVYFNLGDLYRETGDLKYAIDAFSKSDSVYSLIDYSYGLAYAKGNIGLVYAAQNKLDSAEVYLNESIKILEPFDDNYAVSSYLNGLSEVYFKRQQFQKAEKAARRSLRLAKDYGLKEQIKDASLQLSIIYNQSQEFESAFFHHKQYVAYRDSINNEESIRKIANLHTKYEVAQKQGELDAEKSEKVKYLIIAISSISFLGLILILSFFGIKTSRERKKTNATLEEQRKELELANATKDKFFSILSHDLRSPLATFNTYSEVIDLCVQQKEIDRLSDISNELKSSSANLLDLLDNLLHWGVNQMGASQIVLSNVSVKDVVLLEVAHLKNISVRKQVDVIISIPDEITLYVDRVSMAMAIRNLINNALKFTSSGGSIRITANVQNDQTILKIADTGVGMTSEQKESLFDFNSIDSSYGTQNEKGVGLGLQLVCEFVKNSGAKIKVESKVGEGTTFVLSFDTIERLECEK